MSSSESNAAATSFNEKLASFLKDGQDWSRFKTSIPGVFVLKMPAFRNSPTRLAVELNPVDSSGTPTKKRGLMLRTKDELDEFRKLFVYDKLLPLVSGVEGVNPPSKRAAGKPGEDVLEI